MVSTSHCAAAVLNRSVRVALLDADDTRSAAVRTRLERVPGFAPLQSISSTAEAVRLIRKEGFNVALIELATRGMAGLDCLRSLYGKCGATRLVAFTECCQPEIIMEAFRIGVDGYLLRNDPSLNLIHSLMDLAAGQPVVSGRVLGVLVDSVRRRRPPHLANLSMKERAILDLINEGHSCKAIASTLGICLQTVYVHNRNIAKKLGVSGREGIRAAASVALES